MKLSDEMYQQITESINIVGQDEPREADRRSPRLRLSSHLGVALWNEPTAPLSVRVRDLSQGGVGVFHSQRIGLDEQVLIRFPRPDGRTAMVLGTVVYWEPLAENLFGIGIQFDRLVEEREISQQSEQSTQMQVQQMSIMARFAQSVARSWRVAS